jgi:hypothetical protein
MAKVETPSPGIGTVPPDLQGDHRKLLQSLKENVTKLVARMGTLEAGGTTDLSAIERQLRAIVRRLAAVEAATGLINLIASAVENDSTVTGASVANALDNLLGLINDMAAISVSLGAVDAGKHVETQDDGIIDYSLTVGFTHHIASGRSLRVPDGYTLPVGPGGLRIDAGAALYVSADGIVGGI